MIKDVFSEVKRHYTDGFQETDRRRTGRGRVGAISFDEADELFRSWIDESKWPYDALLFDPRIFTFIFEKTARLLGNQLRGELVPREGSDVLGAFINNEILDFQWDQANHGGSMLQKWALMDMATRKYGASFALCAWRWERDKNNKVVFDGPEMKVLNNRDCAFDASATSIETCNWFQVREYVTFQELQRVNDSARSKPIYQNLDKLRVSIDATANSSGGDSRDSNWISRSRAIAGLTNSPVGSDQVFKHIEICTEYRKDEWITFAPKHGVTLRRSDNPYNVYEIPITMLRYYPIDDDLYGLSEIEPVKSLQRAINAILCHYVDEINMRLYAPVAIGPGVRQHTLEWGKGARWMMNNPMSDFRIVESQPSGAIAMFNNTYSGLVSAMMNSLGESSAGVSNIGHFQPDKTATEVRQLSSQRNARDNFNQMFLSEAIERQMRLWYAMNQKMIFSDPKRQYYVIKIVGKEANKYFDEQQLNQFDLTDHSRMLLETEMDKLRQEVNSPAELEMLKQKLFKQYATPINPIDIGTLDSPHLVPKYNKDKNTLYVEKSDLIGTYDYVADVKSMAAEADENEKTARNKAITALLSNPNVIALLAEEGVKPKFKELFISWLEDAGFKDADRYFETVNQESSGQPGQPSRSLPQGKPPVISINFKDLPPEGQVQAALGAGIRLGSQGQQQLPPQMSSGTDGSPPSGPPPGIPPGFDRRYRSSSNIQNILGGGSQNG